MTIQEPPSDQSEHKRPSATEALAAWVKAYPVAGRYIIFCLTVLVILELVDLKG